MNPRTVHTLAMAGAVTAGMENLIFGVPQSVRTDQVNWDKVRRWPRSLRRSQISKRSYKNLRPNRLREAKEKYARDKRAAMMNPAWYDAGQQQWKSAWLERRFPV